MNTGLVLSGGGFKGIAHIGVIKALDEVGFEITHIAGTSAGAIIGALYAGGLDWKQILEFIKKVNIFSINNYAVGKPGFVDTEKFCSKFAEFFPADNFESLKIPLFITATNILDGSLKVFTEGELIRPILALKTTMLGLKILIHGIFINRYQYDTLTHPQLHQFQRVFLSCPRRRASSLLDTEFSGFLPSQE